MLGSISSIECSLPQIVNVDDDDATADGCELWQRVQPFASLANNRLSVSREIDL